MESTNVLLYKSTDAEDSYAIKLEGDAPDTWRAQRGYGAAFRKVWTVELQSQRPPDVKEVDWDSVLTRMVEAYDMNDPVIATFQWPLRQTV